MTEQIVWEATLDDVYDCKVARTDDYSGVLTVSLGGAELFKQPVGLSYGAIFGPDAADVAEWQDICAAEVDRLKELG